MAEVLNTSEGYTPEAALAVETWAISRVKPYEGNPRKRDKAAVDQVAQSLKEFGFRQPIVVDEHGVIVVGHTRLAAAQQLGLKEVPVHVAKLTAEQARAYRIADNRTNEFTRWDNTLLAAELKELRELELMPFTGFDEKAMDDLLDSHDKKGMALDLVGVTLAEPRAHVVVGDVWKLGHHVLVVESIITGWPKWAERLKPGMLLCPYPTPHVALTDRARDTPCLLVQPDPFVAAHCIDRFEERFGGTSKL